MMLTDERGKKLMEYFEADPARAQELLDLPVDEALAKINAEGHDFTQEELEAFDALLCAEPEATGELDAEALDDVAGGWGSFFRFATPQLTFSVARWRSPFSFRPGRWGGRRRRYY